MVGGGIMKGFIEVNRTTEEEIKEGFLQTRWIDRRNGKGGE